MPYFIAIHIYLICMYLLKFDIMQFSCLV